MAQADCRSTSIVKSMDIVVGRKSKQCKSEELPTHGISTIISGQMSSNVEGKMTIPDQITTST